MSITPEQFKKARHLLGWSRTAIASRMSATFPMVQTFEAEGRIPIGFNPAKARAAFEVAGVEFMLDNGVRLREATR